LEIDCFMEKINWSSYDFDDFELFCGALFTFEFGKSYKPFLAAGKDGGIDGSFEGIYGQYSGKWRFQFKFSSSLRANMVSRLKTEIRTEATKLGDEDFFVLVRIESKILSSGHVQAVKDCSA